MTEILCMLCQSCRNIFFHLIFLPVLLKYRIYILTCRKNQAKAHVSLSWKVKTFFSNYRIKFQILIKNSKRIAKALLNLSRQKETEVKLLQFTNNRKICIYIVWIPFSNVSILKGNFTNKGHRFFVLIAASYLTGAASYLTIAASYLSTI